MAGLALAFGLFFVYSCQTPGNTLEKARSSQSKERYDKALASVESHLEEHPEDAEAHMVKGSILLDVAHSIEDPGERTTFYNRMRESLLRARELYQRRDTASGELQNINNLLHNSWNEEQQQGRYLVESDTLKESEPLQKALRHFGNATTILPDTAVSYRWKAQVLYRLDRVDEAVKALESAHARIEQPSAKMLEQLAYLYMRNSQPDRAIALYRQANTSFKGNTNLLRGLINAYIEQDNHQQAVDLLPTLIKQEPKQAEYHLTYGSELYFLAGEKADSLSEQADNGSAIELDSIEKDVIALLQRAEYQYQKADSLTDHNDPRITYATGMFYKNSAAQLSRLQSRIGSDQRSMLQEQIDVLLEAAIPYLNQAASTATNDNKYWQQLYEVYTALGRHDEAKQARQKANQL